VHGPLSVLQSFGKIDYKRICNGGPLTPELSDGLFRGKDSLRKVGLFMRAFLESSCQQMQLNTLNVETLRDAQRHPERQKTSSYASGAGAATSASSTKPIRIRS
jgi:pyruvate-formate lyase